MGNFATRLARKIARKALLPVPRRLRANQLAVDAGKLKAVEDSLRENYHSGWRGEERYSPAACEKDRRSHLTGRLANSRETVIPWLDRAGPLAGRRVLEIGCGTGSSTVALAEQGAKVTAIDVDAGALRVAADRLGAYGLAAEVRPLNADGIGQAFAAASFDLVIFYACLEHMTVPERLASLRAAWGLLPPAGQLAVVDTPNRLWYRDRHTSQLPFFHWLPDELAFRYSRFSPRDNFRELYREYDAASAAAFLRRGRGVSFHEFDLALGPVGELAVVSSLSSYQGIGYRWKLGRLERRYRTLLRRAHPGLHQGFFDENLCLVIARGSPSP